MAAAMGLQSGSPPSFSSAQMRRALNKNERRNRVAFISTSSTTISDPYETLWIRPGASEYEVKKEFRRLALQVGIIRMFVGLIIAVNFHQINEAYDVLRAYALNKAWIIGFLMDIGGALLMLRALSLAPVVLNQLREESAAAERESYYDGEDLSEEWMGWEGAGIRDYSSHINPYI